MKIRKHQCGYKDCTLSFVKNSHLERHQRTHTNLRDFECPECDQAFSRKDSRDRHISRWHSRKSVPAVNDLAKKQAVKDTQNLTVVPRATTRVNSIGVARAAASSTGDDASTCDSRLSGSDSSTSTLHSSAHTSNESHPASLQETFTDLSDQRVDTNHPDISERIDFNRPADQISDPDSQEVVSHLGHQSHCTVPSLSPFFGPTMGNLLWDSMEASFATTFDTLMAGHSTSAETFTEQLEVFTPAHYTVRASGARVPDTEMHSIVPAGWEREHDVPLTSLKNGQQDHDQEARHRFSSAHVHSNNDHLEATSPNQLQHHRIGLQTHQRSKSGSMPPKEKNIDAVAEKMQAEVHRLVANMNLPLGVDNDFTHSCLWLYHRNLSPLLQFVCFGPKEDYADKPALMMNLISLGSIWHEDENVKFKGQELWKFTLRTMWSNAHRSVQTNEKMDRFMSALLTGHIYVLRSSNKAIHDMGRHAWLFAHLFINEKGWRVYDDKLDVILRQSSSFDEEILRQAWSKWRTEQVRFRLILYLGILDSEHAQSLQLTPALQDTVAETPLPAPDYLLEVTDLHEWLQLYRMHSPSPQPRLASLCLELFSPFRLERCRNLNPAGLEGSISGRHITFLSLLSLLEIMHASWCQQLSASNFCRGWRGRTSSVPAGHFVMLHALANWHALKDSSPILHPDSSYDVHCTGIRWHAIQMIICSSQVDIVGFLRSRVERAQSISSNPLFPIYPGSPHVEKLSIAEWSSTSTARRGLYHAGAIFALYGALPRASPCPMHVAQAIFDAAMLLVATTFTKTPTSESITNTTMPSATLSTTSFELVRCPDKDWHNLGLAGFEEAESQILDGSAESFTWPEMLDGHSTSTNESRTVRAKDWIQSGSIRDAIWEDVSLKEGGNLLRAVLPIVESVRLIWCFAPDCFELLRASAQQSKVQ